MIYPPPPLYIKTYVEYSIMNLLRLIKIQKNLTVYIKKTLKYKQKIFIECQANLKNLNYLKKIFRVQKIVYKSYKKTLTLIILNYKTYSMF